MAVSLLLDAGEHPVSNCYLQHGQQTIAKPLLLGRCEDCALLQLCKPFTENELFNLVPHWVRYREPEEHLDELTSILCENLADSSARVAGLTYIDEPILERLRHLGYGAIAPDFFHGGRERGDGGIEAMLHQVREGGWTSGGTQFDVVVARHVLDHSRDLEAFLSFIASCLSPGGLVVFEVPDSKPFLDAGEYLMLWESHANYFTQATLKALLTRNGFSVRSAHRFASAGAAVLVAICAKSSSGNLPGSVSAFDHSDALPISLFVRNFPETRAAVAARLREIRKRDGAVALFGAGHLGSLFVNIFGVGDLIDFAVDDDPNKRGLELPGSRLSILPTDAIYERDVRVILLATSLASEDGLARRLREKRNALKVASIYAKSPRNVLRCEWRETCES